ncbi:MAG: hypothetical protein ACJ72N_08085 [Labedaea sp.]
MRSVLVAYASKMGATRDIAALAATPGGRRRAGRLGARAPTGFGGRLDPELATGLFDRSLARRMPGDVRDFGQIRAWAGQIAGALSPRHTTERKADR